MSLHDAVNVTIARLELAESDKAAGELALTYAQAIDDGGDLDRLGPLLLAALTALGATPAARARLLKGDAGGDGASPLDEIRARRRARLVDAATLDAATT